MTGPRLVPVPAGRLPGWVERFGAAHGGTTSSPDVDGVRLDAGDGSWAVLRPLFGAGDAEAGTVVDVAALAARAAAPPRCAVLAVRRGGFACAVVDSGVLVAHKAGRRHVQGRTAAGGWSQQRFARRRDKQTHELVEAAVATAARVLLPHLPVAALVTAGDAPLVEDVLGEHRLAALARVPRAAHVAAPDPDGAWVQGLPALLSAVQVTVLDVTR